MRALAEDTARREGIRDVLGLEDGLWRVFEHRHSGKEVCSLTELEQHKLRTSALHCYLERQQDRQWAYSAAIAQ